MPFYSPRVTQKEKERILQLHTEGLNFEVISQRVGRPSRTCARIVKAAETKKKKHQKV